MKISQFIWSHKFFFWRGRNGKIHYLPYTIHYHRLVLYGVRDGRKRESHMGRKGKEREWSLGKTILVDDGDGGEGKEKEYVVG